MFRIQAADLFGNLRTNGGDNIGVTVSGLNGLDATYLGVVKDIGDGTYNASFTVDVKGTYGVYVAIQYEDRQPLHEDQRPRA